MTDGGGQGLVRPETWKRFAVDHRREEANTGEPRGLLFPQKWRHLWSRLGK